MLHPNKLWIAVFVLFAAGCCPESPTVTTEATTVTPSTAPAPLTTLGLDVLLTPTPGATYDPNEVGKACEDSSLFDLEKATTNAQTEDPPRPILWTFGVNFEGYSNGIPLGCLKLYYGEIVDGVVTSYAPINDGGFVVDTCQPKGSARSAQAHPPHSVYLENNGYYDCELRIADWIDAVSNAVRPISETIGSALHRFNTNDGASSIEYHDYNYFTLLAAAELQQEQIVKLEENLTVIASVGIAAYRQGSPGQQLSTEPATLEINVTGRDDLVIMSFRDCISISLPSLNVFWFDATATDRFYSYQDMQQSVFAPCGKTTANGTFRFYTKHGNLLIGHTPDSDLTFQGWIYEVLLDPTDSKPPDKD